VLHGDAEIANSLFNFDVSPAPPSLLDCEQSLEGITIFDPSTGANLILQVFAFDEFKNLVPNTDRIRVVINGDINSKIPLLPPTYKHEFHFQPEETREIKIAVLLKKDIVSASSSSTTNGSGSLQRGNRWWRLYPSTFSNTRTPSMMKRILKHQFSFSPTHSSPETAKRSACVSKGELDSARLPLTVHARAARPVRNGQLEEIRSLRLKEPHAKQQVKLLLERPSLLGCLPDQAPPQLSRCQNGRDEEFDLLY